MNRTNARPSASSSRGLEMQYCGHVDLNEVDPTSPWYNPRNRNLGQALFGHPPQELPYSDDERSSSSYFTQHTGTSSVKDLLMAAMDDSSCLDEYPNEQDQISLLLGLVAKDADDYDIASDSLEDVVDYQEPKVEFQSTLKDDPEDLVDEEIVEEQPLSVQDEIVEEEEEPIVVKPTSPIHTPVKKTTLSSKPKLLSTVDGSKKRRTVVTKKTSTILKPQTSE